MNIEEIRAVVKLMSDHDLTEFKIEAEDMHMCIRRGQQGAAAVPTAVFQAAPPAMQAPQQTSAAPAAAKPAEKRETIDSPIVGTFYSASSPDTPAFVKIGDRVTPETVVCIVEAMKVMNEIKAEKSGVIKEVLTDNAQPVEYGQALFVIE